MGKDKSTSKDECLILESHDLYHVSKSFRRVAVRRALISLLTTPSGSPNSCFFSNMDANTDPSNSNILPSQIFTTVAALLPAIDRRIVVVLHDGRKLFGVLRSFDQFGMSLGILYKHFVTCISLTIFNHLMFLMRIANLVIQDTVERIYINQQTFGETSRGVFIVRGENVVYVGELDENLEEQEDALIIDSETSEANLSPFPKLSPGALLADRQQQKFQQQQQLERNPETGLPVIRRIPFQDAERIFNETSKTTLDAHVKQRASLPNAKFDDLTVFVKY